MFSTSSLLAGFKLIFQLRFMNNHNILNSAVNIRYYMIFFFIFVVKALVRIYEVIKFKKNYICAYFGITYFLWEGENRDASQV